MSLLPVQTPTTHLPHLEKHDASPVPANQGLARNLIALIDRCNKANMINPNSKQIAKGVYVPLKQKGTALRKTGLILSLMFVPVLVFALTFHIIPLIIIAAAGIVLNAPLFWCIDARYSKSQRDRLNYIIYENLSNPDPDIKLWTSKDDSFLRMQNYKINGVLQDGKSIRIGEESY